MTDKALSNASEKLEQERDDVLRFVVEFMRAFGVALANDRPQGLLIRLTQYGARCLDIGQELAHERATIHPAAEPSARGASWDDEVTPARGVRGRRRREPTR